METDKYMHIREHVCRVHAKKMYKINVRDDCEDERMSHMMNVYRVNAVYA